MPGFSGTGPRGQGPMTGRGLGYCALSKEQIEQMQKEGLIFGPPGLGLGGGRGRFGMGRGRGFGRGFGYRRFPW